MKLVRFAKNEFLTNNLEELTKNSEYNKAQKGKWYHWQRFYVIKSSANEYGLVTLNFFERWALSICKINVFKKVFSNKKIVIISPKNIPNKVRKVQTVAHQIPITNNVPYQTDSSDSFGIAPVIIEPTWPSISNGIIDNSEAEIIKHPNIRPEITKESCEESEDGLISWNINNQPLTPESALPPYNSSSSDSESTEEETVSVQTSVYNDGQGKSFNVLLKQTVWYNQVPYYICEDNQHLFIFYEGESVPLKSLPFLLLQTFRKENIEPFKGVFLTILSHPDFEEYIEEFLTIIFNDLSRHDCSWLIPFWEKHFHVLTLAFENSHRKMISFLKEFGSLSAIKDHEKFRSQIVGWIETEISKGNIPYKIACEIEACASSLFTSKFVFKNNEQSVTVNAFLIQALAFSNSYFQAFTKGNFKEGTSKEIIVEDDFIYLTGLIEYIKTGNFLDFLRIYGDDEGALYDLESSFDYRLIPDRKEKFAIPLMGLKILKAIDEKNLENLRHHFEKLAGLLRNMDFEVTSFKGFTVYYQYIGGSHMKPWLMDQLCQVLKLVAQKMEACEVKLILGEMSDGYNVKSHKRNLSHLSKLTTCLAPYVIDMDLSKFWCDEGTYYNANNEICSIIEQSAPSFLKLNKLTTGIITHSLFFKLLREAGQKLNSLNCSKERYIPLNFFSEVTAHCPHLATLYFRYTPRTFKEYNDFDQLMTKCPHLHIQFKKRYKEEKWLEILISKYSLTRMSFK